MSGGPSPYEVRTKQVTALARMLVAIYEAAEHSDSALYNVVKQAEHSEEYPRSLVEVFASSRVAA